MGAGRPALPRQPRAGGCRPRADGRVAGKARGGALAPPEAAPAAVRHAPLRGRAARARHGGGLPALARPGARPARTRNASRPDSVRLLRPTSARGLDALGGLDGVEIVDETLFLTHPDEFAEWAGAKRKLRMEDFYRWQRRRLDVLMDGAEPVAGRWNFDAENREPPPADARPPRPYLPREDQIDAEVRADTRPHAPDDLRRRRPPPLAGHARPGAESAEPVRGAAAAGLRALAGRHAGRRAAHVALAHLVVAQPGVDGASGAGRRGGGGAGPTGAPRWPPWRASCARSSAGGSTCGAPTGITPTAGTRTTRWTRTRRCRGCSGAGPRTCAAWRTPSAGWRRRPTRITSSG